MINDFNLKVEYEKDPNNIIIGLKINVTKNNKKIKLVTDLLSIKNARLITSPNYNDVIKGLDLYKEAVEAHLKEL